MKFMLASETVFFGSSNSVNTILATLNRTSAERPSDYFTIGNLL